MNFYTFWASLVEYLGKQITYRCRFVRFKIRNLSYCVADLRRVCGNHLNVIATQVRFYRLRICNGSYHCNLSLSAGRRIPFYTGARRFGPKTPYSWAKRNRLTKPFNSNGLPFDNQPGPELDCILVYLNSECLRYKYGNCLESHYFMCSSKADGK